jgi:hypothetical protein
MEGVGDRELRIGIDIYLPKFKINIFRELKNILPSTRSRNPIS